MVHGAPVGTITALAETGDAMSVLRPLPWLTEADYLQLGGAPHHGTTGESSASTTSTSTPNCIRRLAMAAVAVVLTSLARGGKDFAAS